jgi:hypothetical protein
MRMVVLGIGALLAVALQDDARAELIPGPVRTFSSADGLTHFRVTRGEPQTEAATGRVFRETDGKEETVWEGKLVNTPDRAFVASNGSVATVENHSHQWDQHAVVVYDVHGKAVADLQLNRFLGHQEILDRKAANRESVILWDDSWTGACRFTMNDRGGEFIVEPPSGRLRRISLATGEVSLGVAGIQLEAPIVSLIGTSTENGLSLVFEAMNPNDIPMYYAGYARDSFSPPIPAGVMYPLYSQELERNGVWESVNVGHCKTGQGEVAIPARSSQRFSIYVAGELKEPIRYGLRWHKGSDQWATETVWSRTITQSDVDRLVKARDGDAR